MFFLASGLKSLILGENQILGQIKRAYQISKNNNCLGKLLEKLLQYTFYTAKLVHNKTNIGKDSLSIARCSVKIAKKIFTKLSEQNAMIVGAGEMAQIFAKYLIDNNINSLIIANRTLENAKKITKKYNNSSAIDINNIGNIIDTMDIIITLTNSDNYIFNKVDIEKVSKKRKRKPIFMLDISVPRNIDPAIDDLDDIYLYTIDNLKKIIEKNNANRFQANKEANTINIEEINNFQNWLNTLDNENLILEYRQKCNNIKSELLSEAVVKLKKGKAAEVVLNEFADKLTNKFLHKPSLALKKNGLDNSYMVEKIVRELLL